MTAMTPATSRLTVHSVHLSVLRVAALTVLLGTAACSPDASSTAPQPPNNPAGLYTLQQVDQTSLPAEVFHGRYESPYFDYTIDPLVVTVTDGSINLSATGDVQLAVNYSTWAWGTAMVNTYKFIGTYQISGDRIRLDAGGTSVLGSYKNDVITVSLAAYDPAAAKKPYAFRYTP